MKVGIIGSGGREHAICQSISKKKVKKIYCFPGNAGTSEIAENIEINLSNFNEIKEQEIKNKIDLSNSWARKTTSGWNCRFF